MKICCMLSFISDDQKQQIKNLLIYVPVLIQIRQALSIAQPTFFTKFQLNYYLKITCTG
jgi:hypothetical protein